MADIERALTGGSPNNPAITVAPDSIQIMQRAVVVDTLNNLSLRDEEYLALLKQTVSNPEDLEIAPRNSIVAKKCGKGKGRTNEPATVCFPFFSSHIRLPIKAGEQVWIMFETPAQPETRGYWLSRIHEPLHVEDSNYTHGDRRTDPINKEAFKEAEEDAVFFVEGKNKPGFHNGTDMFEEEDDQFTLLEQEAFETIFTETAEANEFVIEPVPRFTSRPGDLVLQGSHNSTIVLGTDRGYKEDDTITNTGDDAKTNAQLEEEMSPGSGAIDIVAGRGGLPSDDPGYIDMSKAESLSGGEDPSKAEKPKRTEPQVAMNSRERFETNKNPSMLDDAQPNHQTNVAEGDPDFFMDASRVYLAMKSEGDANFNLKYPPFAGAPVTDEKPYVIMKSDEVRIVSRKDGSIRIIKEDADDPSNRCVITMLADGTVAIDAKKIIIGDGRDEQVYIGEGATEPIFKGKELQAALDSLADFLNGAIGNMGSPLIGAAAVMPKFKSDVEAALSGVSFTK